MIAIKIPYPPPNAANEWLGSRGLRSLEGAVDFPERGVSYIVGGCADEDWERCAKRVQEAVTMHSPGTEPEHLEIALGDPA